MDNIIMIMSRQIDRHFNMSVLIDNFWFSCINLTFDFNQKVNLIGYF